MKKRCYLFSTTVLTALAIFSLMGSNNVLAENVSNNQAVTYSEEIPSAVSSVWTKGVTPPTNFIEGVDGAYSLYEENQGWYDITKTFDGKDNLLCGAATAGNMLHWWFDQNREQIAHYLQQHPEKQTILFRNEKMFDLKEAIDTKNSQVESALFTYFRDKAFPEISSRQRGIFPDHVLDMFINGYRLDLDNYGPTIIKAGNKDLRGGIFDHVFHRGVHSEVLSGRHNLRNLGIKEISQLIKKELEEDKALGISHTYGNVRVHHVVNLWGADFDSEGNIEAIYVTDSDSNKSIGMKKYYVGVNSAGKVSISYKKIEGENRGAQILELYTLSAGKDIWNQNS